MSKSPHRKDFDFAINHQPATQYKPTTIKLFFLLLFLLTSNYLLAQMGQLYGSVSTTQGEAMPYANVIILGKSQGTSTNFDGEYSLQLKPGTYKVSYQFVGYKSELKEVTIQAGERLPIHVSLEEEKVYLDAVVVKASSENPAYEIIRNAQKMRKTYLREHENISYEAYTKLFGKSGTNNSSAINLFGTMLNPHKGIFYLSETVSSLYKYNAHEKNEQLKASLIMGDTSNYSKNKSVFIELYESRPFSVVAQTVRNRFISPIANDAFGFYDYDYLGSIEEGNQLLHKIKLLPRSTGTNTFTGEIYIVDKSWRVYKSHLFTNSPIIGKMEINTTYIADEQENVLLPFSTSFILKDKSRELDIYHHNIFYDYVFDAPVPTIDKQANYIVGDSSLQKPDEWWEKQRPISLTEDEQLAYQQSLRLKSKDQNVRENINDSLPKSKKSPFRIFQQALGTGNITLTDNLALKLNVFTFNTVEGGVLKPHFVYRKEMKSGRELETDVALRYGFASRQFYAKGGVSYELNPLSVSKLRLEGGRYIEQISGNTSVSDFVNMAYSLDSKLNYQKLYGRDYISLQWGQELINGLDIKIGSNYNLRHPLENNSDYNWDKKSETAYMPNQSFIQGEYIDFESNQLWESNIAISYQHNRKFDLIKGRKVPLTSKYPKVSVGFDLGVMESEYSRFWANISNNFNFGPVGVSNISVSYGEFLTSNNLTPVDYFHFMGNQTIFYQRQKQYGLSYQLLDYYQYSNDSYFAGANFEHDFGNAIFGRVPLLKKLGLNTYFMANFLQSGDYNSFSELGVGLSMSYLPIRFNYFFGFEGNNYNLHGFMMHTNF
ncbi:carboxypeptidase-like regulatory domain-containing protein [Marivirga sp. S37H4]|uniref:Carboxypeptidase-like regulatory domain-containing protein n=1 Tax=Marivirga aurantiaca TaxID=2802615 RepID=A0A935C625_9BACT|nr:DUF5686 and carboxypeptidase regulatory-like domain-containing protein [Marivirga aurantiaca]MBK6264130.1 carboxypeptidase-like regulatory domain-containing protein [Marivirga aurantiaca]